MTQRQAPDPFKLSTWKLYLRETMVSFGKAFTEIVEGGSK